MAEVKKIDKEAKSLPYTKPLPLDELLALLLDSIKPIDFTALIYPDSIQISEDIAALKPYITNPDGSFKEGVDSHFKEYQRLSKKMEKFKLTDAKIIVACLVQLKMIAEKNNWHLAKRDGTIWAYNQCYWEPIGVERFHDFLNSVALKLGVEPFKAMHFKFRDDLLKQYLSSYFLPVNDDKDKSTVINLENGTLRIGADGSRKLTPFNYKDFVRHQLKFPYDVDAKSPLFDSFITTCLDDESKRMVLAEFVGYCFVKTSVLRTEKMILLLGAGRNGKSLFISILNALLGSENVSSYSLQSLTDDSGKSRAEIANKLLNASPELSEKINIQTFKMLCSGEDIEARSLYKQPFIMKDYAKLLSATNSMPRDTESVLGYYRRFLIINWNYTVPEKDVDPDLANKIIESELSGILNWVLLGLDRLLKNRGFSKSKAIDQALEDFKTQSDSVNLWAKDSNYIKTDEPIAKLSDIYRLYRFYCEQDGYIAVSLKKFRPRLEAMGYESKRFSEGWRMAMKSESHDHF